MKYAIAVVMALVLSGVVRAEGAAEHGGHSTAATKPVDLGVVSLDVYAEGARLHLLTAAGSPAVLGYRWSGDGGKTWSGEVRVGEGQAAPSPIHRGMDAQIAAAGDRLVAAWTTAGEADRFGRGPIATAYSSDGGKTWVAGPNPADDGLATGHAFLDLAADAKGAFHLVWLDGRDNASGKGLRYARSDDGGANWTRNKTLDAQTCECCWNTIVTERGGGVAVLYRDCGPRDMGLVRSEDGGKTWGSPVGVGKFSWDVNVCPHVGGGLALGAGGAMFATVWTGAGEAAGGYVLTSGDRGEHWSEPRRLGAKAWHTDVAADGRGGVAVVWDTHGEGVFGMVSGDGGKTWSDVRRVTAEGASATHPRVVWTGNGFRVFWTGAGKDGRSSWGGVMLAD